MVGGLVVGGVFGSASRHFTEPRVPILILGSLRSVAMCQVRTLGASCQAQRNIKFRSAAPITRLSLS
jgi:hypothetical protein